MGMGEPLANYDATRGALDVITDGPQRKWASRPAKLPFSTAGLLPQMRRLMEETRVNLANFTTFGAGRGAFRAHAGEPPSIRFAQLLECCRSLPVPRRKRITSRVPADQRLERSRRGCGRACGEAPRHPLQGEPDSLQPPRGERPTAGRRTLPSSASGRRCGHGGFRVNVRRPPGATTFRRPADSCTTRRTRRPLEGPVTGQGTRKMEQNTTLGVIGRYRPLRDGRRLSAVREVEVGHSFRRALRSLRAGIPRRRGSGVSATSWEGASPPAHRRSTIAPTSSA